MRIISVVGARPNFMKLAPVARALRAHPDATHLVVHTGQHYDESMSGTFFADLGLAPPDFNLDVRSGSHAEQTAAALTRCATVFEQERPDWVLVYGDVNSTVAATLAAVKLGCKVAHVEAGLRSRDRTMPEEHNRVATDHLADLLLTPSRDAIANLKAEGIASERIAFVGNVMIDTLIGALPAAKALDAPGRHGVRRDGYVLVTLHRPANVDDPAALTQLCRSLEGIARRYPVVFPVHPRTRQRLKDMGWGSAPGLHVTEPVSYLEMLGLVEGARAVVTDSGGLQEETSFLGIPCFTVRPNTERPVTITEGTNQLVSSPAALASLAFDRPPARGRVAIERWDGKAGERIAAVLCRGARFD